jgi:hypothetical protein
VRLSNYTQTTFFFLKKDEKKERTRGTKYALYYIAIFSHSQKDKMFSAHSVAMSRNEFHYSSPWMICLYYIHSAIGTKRMNCITGTYVNANVRTYGLAQIYAYINTFIKIGRKIYSISFLLNNI